MGVEAFAQKIIYLRSVTDLKAYFKTENQTKVWYLLSGGSNTLFVSDFPGTVLKMEIKYRSVQKMDDHFAIVSAGAGESWPDFVSWTLEQNLGGLENLSLIPGQVGAAPIQNIGAYGIEVKDRILFVEAFDISTGKIVKINGQDCGFEYRNSHFKGQWKGRYIITKVHFKLTRENHPLHTNYGAIASELEGIESPTIQDVAQVVIRIRRSKLPDPQELGNTGSFFKNPMVAVEQFEALQKEFSQIPAYPASETEVKIPAAWLIDQCGWKGKREGEVGCYEKQPLVIANYGQASGAEVWAFAQKVQQSVFEKFGILLEPEVNIIGH